MNAVHAVLRGAPKNLPFVTDLVTLRNGLNFTLDTDAGPLDVLGEIAGVGGYHEAREGASIFELFGNQYAVLALDTLINPVLIVEVLLDTTKAFYRGAKFGHYGKIDFLIEYLLVSQREYRIGQYVRQSEGPWSRSQIRGLNPKLDLTSIGCSLDYAEIYDRITVIRQNH